MERLHSLALRLQGLGVARSADDVRAVADDLRDTPDEELRSGGIAVDRAIERLTMIYARLTRGRLTRSADDLKPVLDDLHRLVEPRSP